MQTEIEIEGLKISLIQKKIKNVYIGIYPPEGRIQVSAPAHYSRDRILEAIRPRLSWMSKQQQKFLKRAELMSSTKVLGSANQLFYLGLPFHYVFQNDHNELSVDEQNRKILFFAKTTANEKQKAAIIKKFHCEFLQYRIHQSIETWSRKLNVQVSGWTLRQMKSKWGSCNVIHRKIVFNLELAKHSLGCIDYVVAHELIHLIEPSHNARFKKLMTDAIPNWKKLKLELQQIPLNSR
jgi:predicted metal-dependent hydrolase